MAGSYVSGQRYMLNGVYGTAQEHAARQQTQQNQQPYDASKPSAGSANTAANTVGTNNPNLDFGVDATGRTSLSNTSAQARATMDHSAQIAEEQDALKRKQTLSDRNSLVALMDKQNAGSAATVQYPGAQEQDARAAAFSRAKDQAGKIARSSLTAISESMANRGLSGSNMQALYDAGAINGAEAPLQELTRDQMMSDFNRAGDVSDMTYQGNITQRGQDLSNRASYMSLLAGLY